MSRRELTWTERTFLRLYHPFFIRMNGFRNAFDEELIRTHGLGGFLRFAQTLVGTLNTLTKRYDEATAQHLAGFAGLLNGCRYCGVGHNLTGNLLIFKETGKVYPIDELDVPELQRLDDEEIMASIRDKMRGSEFEDQLALIERMYQIKLGVEDGETPDDPYLRAVLAMWDYVNECSVEVGLDIDPNEVPAFNPLNKDREFYDEYRKARAAAD